MMILFKYFIVIIFISLSGCLTGNMQTPLGIPVPWIDRKMHTYQTILADYDIDLRTKNHDMQGEIDSAISAQNINNKIFNTNSPANIDQFKLSQKLGSNDYYLGFEPKKGFEQQHDANYCWASCVQYMVLARYDKYISQEDIISKYVKNAEPYDGGSIADMFKGLGYGNLQLSADGATQIMNSLSVGLPVMIGVREPDAEVGHVLLVYGTRYSFVSDISPQLPPSGGMAFAEFDYFDPADGKPHRINADEIIPNLDFVLSYYFF